VTAVSTPVYSVHRTEEGARATVRRQMDGVQAEASPVADGSGYHAVALLRSDQEWLRPRLEERGIKCVQTDPEAARAHVSDEMIRAGMQALRDCFSAPPTTMTVAQSELVRRVHAAMESAR
jgi:hypothetical protein